MALLTVGQLVRAMGHFSSFSRLASAKRGHLFQPIQNGLTHEHAAVASRTNWLCISLPKSCMIGRHVSRLFQECSIRDASPFETTYFVSHRAVRCCAVLWLGEGAIAHQPHLAVGGIW